MTSTQRQVDNHTPTLFDCLIDRFTTVSAWEETIPISPTHLNTK